MADPLVTIDWVNNSQPALNATNLNAMQGNISTYVTANMQEMQAKVDAVTSGIPVGGGCDYFGNTLPSNDFMWADGSAISRTTYATLFNIIGTTYGAGDGSTTFNLPDKRTRVTIMADSNNYTMGATGGEAEHTLTVSELPTHAMNVRNFTNTTSYGNSGTAQLYNADGTTTTNAGNGDVGMITDNKLTRQTASSFTTYSSSNSAGFGVLAGTTTPIGSGEAHNIMQPYLVCNYIIKVK